ncbi:hypothetical protein WICPIJ_009422 [Wickerhamomyces pijperi]|uniref:Uncharacterized protein n=1 Tax=Wickerhamomyces pijperi TaxID=599730 RepID=A0A9P8TCZ0_WICPI|nr:hypothetical protein WICPIJ_009422 [Wickerhamomyces pijperi]
MPILRANVPAMWPTATGNDNTKDHKPNHGDDFDYRKHKLSFTVASDTEQIDQRDQSEENGHPHSTVDRIVPILDRYGGSDQFNRNRN